MLALLLVGLFNQSLALGVMPSALKVVYITPQLNKLDLDSDDVKSYRPISNLSVLSNRLERLIVRQLLDYLTASRLLPDLQSAYSRGQRIVLNGNGGPQGSWRYPACNPKW